MPFLHSKKSTYSRLTHDSVTYRSFCIVAVIVVVIVVVVAVVVLHPVVGKIEVICQGAKLEN